MARYKFTIGFVLSIIIAIILHARGIFDVLIDAMNSYGYIGALIVGLFYSSSFTSPLAALFFVNLGEHLNPLPVALLGGIGAMMGDMVLYTIIKASVIDEIKALAAYLFPFRRRTRMERMTRHRVFLWTVPFLASILIASPLPDELGIALFGFINFKPRYLSLLSFLLNTAGIAILVFTGYAIRG